MSLELKKGSRNLQEGGRRREETGTEGSGGAGEAAERLDASTGVAETPEEDRP